MDKLNRLYMRSNKLNVVTLTQEEYAFLRKPGMVLHLHTFNNTKYRDDDPPERIPTCPDAQVISLLYNSSKGNNWFVCLTLETSVTNQVATVLAWIVLISMGATIIYLIVKHYMRSRKQSDVDSMFAISLPQLHFPTGHQPSSGKVFSLEKLLQAISLNHFILQNDQVELLTCIHNTKQEVSDTMWLDTTTNDVTEVWKGVYGKEKQSVIVKRVSGSEMALSFFVKQVQHLSRFNHPHITTFIGLLTQPNSLAIVCAANTSHVQGEYFMDLKQVIPSIHSANMQVKIAMHIALALRYLHSVPQVHGNLHSTSIVVDPSKYYAYLNRLEMIPCDVSKLGLARQSLYVAPEVLSGGPHSAAADIYSFGMLLAELDTGESAFHFLNRSARCVPGRHDLTLTQMFPLRHALTFNRGPLQPAIVLCLQDKPHSRPPISYLMSMLN